MCPSVYIKLNLCSHFCKTKWTASAKIKCWTLLVVWKSEVFRVRWWNSIDAEMILRNLLCMSQSKIFTEKWPSRRNTLHLSIYRMCNSQISMLHVKSIFYSVKTEVHIYFWAYTLFSMSFYYYLIPYINVIRIFFYCFLKFYKCSTKANCWPVNNFDCFPPHSDVIIVKLKSLNY